MVSVHFVLRVSIPRVKKNVADENQAAAVIPDVSLFFFFLTLCRETAALGNDWGVFYIVQFDRLPSSSPLPVAAQSLWVFSVLIKPSDSPTKSR